MQARYSVLKAATPYPARPDRGSGQPPARPTIRELRASRLRDQLPTEDLNVRRDVDERLGAGTIVGQSKAICRVLAQARQVAATDSTVMLLGDTGTGKEMIATLIHQLSSRRSRPMVRVNCAAIPHTLIESELFGREKGAFTGAVARQIGRFELADHSTLFLDEIGDLPPDVQVKLLRVLESRQIERLGSPTSVAVDVRIIVATHRDLCARISRGPVLPAQRVPDSGAATSRAARRYSSSDVAFRRRVFKVVR
jgi:formate hydrogenlyase transcriptional activator